MKIGKSEAMKIDMIQRTYYRIKGFLDEYWYDSRPHRQWLQSNHWNPYEDWLKSRNGDMIHPGKT